ncbi:MAG TPA: hypothetical protein VFY06_15490 [Verrucomicrobiae bacterium]|nr:hypothetical protein [Verrucomicrobiae bacterium]
MQAQPDQLNPHEISTLLRGEVANIAGWLEQQSALRFLFHVGIIIVGAGLYGAAMGWWRDPQQALFTAVKFPLIILLTTAGNALLNAMLAPLFGLNIPFRQTFSAILMSFAIAAAILGAFSPLMAFMVWNAPPISPETIKGATYSLIKLANVAVIAFAGMTGNARLFQLLTRLGGSRVIAWRVLFAWLVVNLFLGSQLSWILRPFIGAPYLPVEFLRQTAFHGNFYENIFHTVQQIFND